MNPIEILKIVDNKLPTSLKEHLRKIGIEVNDIVYTTLMIDEYDSEKCSICFLLSNSYDAYDVYDMDLEEVIKHLDDL